MKLAKLLYLADLEAVERGIDPFTGIRWRWLKFGPFNNDLLDLEDRLVGAGYVARTESMPAPGVREVRLWMEKDPDPAACLQDAFADIVTDVVKEYGDLAPATLRDLTYQTEPMLEAQRENARGEDLDLELARPVPSLEPVHRRLRPILEQLEKQETDPEALQEIADDLERLAPGRAKATSRLLE